MRETVGDLKDIIKETKRHLVDFDADRMALFLAKRDGSWLKVGCYDMEAVAHGEVSDGIQKLVEKEFKLAAAYKLENPMNFGPQFVPVEDEIRILVKFPEERDEVLFHWKRPKKPTRSIGSLLRDALSLPSTLLSAMVARQTPKDA